LARSKPGNMTGCDLSQCRPVFSPTCTVHIRSVVGKVAWGLIFLRAIQFSPTKPHSNSASYSSQHMRCLSLKQLAYYNLSY
jgi:hypothetical protein